jgi:centromeric protein E
VRFLAIWQNTCIFNDKSNFLDNVFDENASTEDIYESLAKPIVSKVLEGFNGTIFAYGQTASGKTHCMVGNNDSPGIIPKVNEDKISLKNFL